MFPCRRFTVCCRRRWATPPVHRFCRPSRCDAYRARFICLTADRESAQAHGRWIRVVELPRIELGSGLLSAFACCHVRRFIPTCVGEDHPWTGAFGEPARLVDDVHVLVGRIHRPTVRPVRFKFSGFRPVNRQWDQSRVSRYEGETGRRNGVGVYSCGKVDDGCPCRPPARSKWFPAGYRKPVSPIDFLPVL